MAQAACLRLAHRKTGIMLHFPRNPGVSACICVLAYHNSPNIFGRLSSHTGKNQSRRKWHRKTVARGLGPTAWILIIVAHVCNYNVNTGRCGLHQQDFVDKKKPCGVRRSWRKTGNGRRGLGVMQAFWLMHARVITLSCVVLWQYFGSYISGKSLMVVFQRWIQLLCLSSPLLSLVQNMAYSSTSKKNEQLAAFGWIIQIRSVCHTLRLMKPICCSPHIFQVNFLTSKSLASTNTQIVCAHIGSAKQHRDTVMY